MQITNVNYTSMKILRHLSAYAQWLSYGGLWGTQDSYIAWKEAVKEDHKEGHFEEVKQRDWEGMQRTGRETKESMGSQHQT